jgi:hypothetical protein
MAIVRRAWARLAILMALLRSFVSWYSGHVDSEPVMARASESAHEESGSDEVEHGLRSQGVSQTPPPQPFEPMRQEAWHYWDEGDADDIIWAVLENQRYRNRQTAALLRRGLAPSH